MSWPEPNLPTAAQQVYNNFYIFWLIEEVKERVLDVFVAQLLRTGYATGQTPIFPNDQEKNRPIASLLVMLQEFGVDIFEGSTAAERMLLSEFEVFVRFVYSICTLTQQQYDDGLISIAQREAVLQAYNDSIVPP